MTSHTKRRFRQSVMIVAGLACGGCSAEATRIWRTARRAETAVSLHVPIDLLQPNRTTAVLRQSYSGSHDQLLLVYSDAPSLSEGDAVQWLRGLDGSVRVHGADGRLAGEYILDAAHARPHDGGLLVSQFAPLPIGEYRVDVEIRSGAARLPAEPLTLVSRYQLCGLEFLPAVGCGVCAAVWGMVVMIAWTCGPWSDTLPDRIA